MRIEDFDYELPNELIARYPAEERSGSRLLVVRDGAAPDDRRFVELPELLSPGDLLVMNDTRVIPARLFGRKATGGRIELLIERVTGEREALAHIRASKTPKPDTVLVFDGGIEAVVRGRDGGMFDLVFDRTVMDVLHAQGEVPLPPYLNRDAESADTERYQTVYADAPGSVAAPTAGLHFDEPLLERLATAGVESTFVTLHVGAGTFQSLRKSDVESNTLHAERVIVSEHCCEKVRATQERGGRVVAIGTTSVRSLEAASADGRIAPFDGETDLFINPGFEFQTVDAMITNFHLPQSSLLMLVAAFSGFDPIMQAYRHAVAERYRFYSYGDAMLLLPARR